MNLFELIVSTLEDRKLAFVDRFALPYVCSAGAHILNIENKKRKFYFTQGRVADLRVHIFFIAPSGFMKSEILYQFNDEDTGLISGGKLSTAFEGGMTAAAFVGTVKATKNGESEVVYGAAQIHAFTIVAIEEFAEITNMMKQTYNVQMADALLTSLDKGWVRKRLARSGEKGIHYQTYVSMWTGSQPTRLDLGAGIGRRFFMLEFIPTREERRIIAEMRRAGRGFVTKPGRVRDIKLQLDSIVERAKRIKRIKFSEDWDNYIVPFGLIHFEEEMFERLALGYTLMSGAFTDTLEVYPTQELKNIISQGIKWRRSIKLDSEANQVVYALRDMGGECTINEMVLELANFSIDGRDAYRLIHSVEKTGRISLEGTRISSRWMRRK